MPPLDLIRLAAEEPGTSALWAMRSNSLQRVYGGGENDALPARGQLGLMIRRAVDAGDVGDFGAISGLQNC